MEYLNIRQTLLGNDNFRKVLITGKHSQVVAMTVQPGDDIGEETHEVDQVLAFIDGTGKAVIGGEEAPIATHDLFFVPAGTLHNFINTGTTAMRVLSIYAPAEHAPGTIHATKADAVAAEAAEHAN